MYDQLLLSFFSGNNNPMLLFNLLQPLICRPIITQRGMPNWSSLSHNDISIQNLIHRVLRGGDIISHLALNSQYSVLLRWPRTRVDFQAELLRLPDFTGVSDLGLHSLEDGGLDFELRSVYELDI